MLTPVSSAPWTLGAYGRTTSAVRPLFCSKPICFVYILSFEKLFSYVEVEAVRISVRPLDWYADLISPVDLIAPTFFASNHQTIRYYIRWPLQMHDTKCQRLFQSFPTQLTSKTMDESIQKRESSPSGEPISESKPNTRQSGPNIPKWRLVCLCIR